MICLNAAGCIKREPRLDAERPVAAGTVQPESIMPASRPPTGNYGKVQGVDVLGGKGIRAFRLGGATDRVRAKYVRIEGQPFAEAIRAEAREPSRDAWDVQLQALTTEPVENGDVLLATVYFRTVATAQQGGEGRSEFVFELARDPWTKSVSQEIHASSEWKQVRVPFIAAQPHAAGEAQAVFRLGYGRQVIELGGAKIENFGKQLALADLPTTKPAYAGMALDAPWRKDAAARIEEVRKAPLRVVVKGADGRPLEGAIVRVEQVRHAFGFGTAATASRLLAEPEEHFHTALGELFNVVTLENDLQWVPLSGEWGERFTLKRATAAVEWLQARDFAVRGHALVWPDWRHLPRSVRALEKKPEELRVAIDAHVRQLVGALRGKMDAWHVANEPTVGRELLGPLGEEVIIEWLKAARAEDPDVELYINDSGILGGSGGNTPRRQQLEALVRRILDSGAPLDGIGMKAHFGGALTSPVELLTILDRFGKLGKKLYVTEFDVNVSDEQLAAEYTRDFYTVVFSHPAVAGVVMWGFWDGSHWKNNAPLYRHDWSLKPAGEVFRQLVLDTWRTRAEGPTDMAGQYAIRAFRGSYRVHASAGERTASAMAELGADGAQLAMVLE